MVDADMLEHADRDDPVVAALLLAVILEMEAHAVGKPGGGGPLGRELVLFDREGEAGDVGAGLAGEIKGEAAPARADIEHLHARLQQQLGGEMPLLVELRRLQIVAGIDEIGAGILPVRIEEEVVERARQVVMMRHVAARAVRRIELLKAAEQDVDPAGQGRVVGVAVQLQIFHEDGEDAVEIALVDGQGAAHEGFAEDQARIEEQPPAQRGIVKPDAGGGTRPVAEFVPRTVRLDDRQPAALHETRQQPDQQHASPAFFFGAEEGMPAGPSETLSARPQSAYRTGRYDINDIVKQSSSRGSSVRSQIGENPAGRLRVAKSPPP